MKDTQVFRKTLAQETTISGIGLHSGRESELMFRPAPPNAGIVFTRNKYYADSSIVAIADNVVDTSLAVTLGNDQWRVQTVEHLMSAISMAGITDLFIDTSNVEIPIMDGSAFPFWQEFENIGYTQYLDFPVVPLEVKNALWVVDGDKYLIALPAKKFQVSYNIHFNHPLLRGQNYQAIIDSDHFSAEIASARTFGFLSEVEYLRSQGLAKGGSIENAIVLDEKGYINPSLRYEDECVRHKVLDLVGDLYLTGRPIHAHIIANKAGHALDVALAKKMLKVERENQFAHTNTAHQNNEAKDNLKKVMTK